MSLNGNYFRGGENTVNGNKQGDLQENSRFGLTLLVPLNERHSVKFNANTGVVTRVGNGFDTQG